MANWLKKLEKLVGGGEGGNPRRNQTFRWLIILALLGVAIMLFNSFVNVKRLDSENTGREPPAEQTLETALSQEDTAASSSFDSIELAMEARTKEILEKIVGVGTVDIMVTVDSTEEIVVQRNLNDSQQSSEETDANGGTRHTTQYTRDGEIVTYSQSGNETPIVTKRIKPEVRGVLVVAKGAENKVVRSLIEEAVAKGLNVPSYRISVVPRKQE